MTSLPEQSYDERIAKLWSAVSLARYNARNALSKGDNTAASAAYGRARRYIEMIRRLVPYTRMEVVDDAA